MPHSRRAVNPLHFVWSQSIAGQAAAVFLRHDARIRTRLPDVQIRHTGGSSVPGVLTSGDVDLQVSVEKTAFAPAREALAELYEPLYHEDWPEDAAYFVAHDADPPVEVALTVIGTLDDLHHGAARDRIAADPSLIEAYNALKRSHEGGLEAAYTAAKRDFFSTNFPPQAAPNAGST
jgi:GrpB-like predicted nucleotidyltransferase (UPF0157 family)